MSYVVLARRYRPQTFEDLVGQEPITVTLRNAIRYDRVAHAYLLAGPRGVGKTSTARILSKALNCKNGPTETPCNVCDICKDISDGTDIDVLEIDGASNRGIDEVRNIRQNVGYAPSRGRYKIYIIDEVHMLTREAFNALLKTLEEPPAHVKFIFATTAVSRLPETVQSRCQRFDFRNISTVDIEKRLSDICRSENVRIDSSALHLIARYAKGGLRDSQSVLDQLLSFCKDKVTQEDVNFVLGAIDEDKISALFDSFLKRDTSSALKVVNDVLNEGKTLVEFIDQLLSYIRELLLFSSCGQDVTWVELNDSFVQRFGKSFAGDTLMYMVQILSETRTRSTDSLLQRILLETAVIKLCRMETISSLNEIVEKITALEQRLGQLPGKFISKEETETPSQKIINQPKNTGQTISERSETEYNSSSCSDGKVRTEVYCNENDWRKILGLVQKKKKSIWALLKEGRFVGCESGAVIIEFPNNYSFHLERLDQEKTLIEQCCREVTQAGIRLQLVLSENGSQRRKNAKQRPGSEPHEQKVDNGEKVENTEVVEPVVRKTLEMFDGQVMKINK